MGKKKKTETEERKRMPFLLRFLIKLLVLVILLLAAMIAFLSVTEYKPEDLETLAIEGKHSKTLSVGDTITVMSWNIGYGALGDNADFFMDGGKMVQTADTGRVNRNMEAIASQIEDVNPQILFVQEIDRSSSRSQHINELSFLRKELTGRVSSFANNFKVAFLPYPIPPMGKVDSGIATFSVYKANDAERVQLPIPFAWPIRMANLKRCLLVTRLPMGGSDKELVLVNLHLEAYDDGEGKIAQTKSLADFLQAEAAKGNFVVAGGDFNQIFSSENAALYPAQEGKWAAGELDVKQFASGFQFEMDETVPSCRSLDQPYEGADKKGFQYYLIDGFIVSGNMTVESCENLDLGFVNSDHNPVVLKVTLE